MFRLFVATLFFALASCCIPIVFPTVPSGTISSDECKGALSPAVSLSPLSLVKCAAGQPGVGATLLAALKLGGDPAAYLQATGQATAAAALRTCMAQELGLLNANDTFNMEKLKAILRSKVTGGVHAVNTEVGLKNCTAVVRSNVQDYMTCVLSFCATGAGPTPKQ